MIVHVRRPTLSVVLPCFDEAGALDTLCCELLTVLEARESAFEVILVDDASTDGTADVIRDWCERDVRFVGLFHAGRFGQSAALHTGLRGARGDVLVTMDADGQADPADIPRLLAGLEGADVACGIRRRRADTALKRAASRVGNGFRRAVTGDATTDAGCTFRAMSRRAVAELPTFDGSHRFLPALLRMQGRRIVEVDVSHRPRRTGRSKYGIRDRLWRGILDCLAMLWWRRRALPSERLVSTGGPTTVHASRGARSPGFRTARHVALSTTERPGARS